MPWPGVVNLLPALPTGPDGELHGEALAEYQSVNGLVGKSVGAGVPETVASRPACVASHRWARDYRNRGGWPRVQHRFPGAEPDGHGWACAATGAPCTSG